MKRLIFPAAVILVLMAGVTGCRVSGDDEDAAGGPNASDPAGYRAQIEVVEDLLYMESPSRLDDYDRIARAMLNLHQKIRDTETNHFALNNANALLFLASRAEGSDAGYSLPNLAPVRKEWEELRSSVFRPADWFRAGGDDVVQAQTPPVPTADVQDVFALTRVIGRLEKLIEDAREEVEELGEPVYNAELISWEGEVQIAKWRKWSTEWEGKLDYVASRLPAHPAWSGEQNYLMAYQDVDHAFHQLRIVPVGVGIWATPFQYQWEQRFSAAADYLAGARRYLESTETSRPPEG
jgi:hypothetical protein